MSSVEEFVRMCKIGNGHEIISKKIANEYIGKIKRPKNKVENLGFEK